VTSGLDDPGFPNHPLRLQAESDLRQVVNEIVRITAAPTRWQGIVVVEGLDYPYAGQKQRWCAISLRQDVLVHPEQRWTTMIHEGLHSVSAALSTGRLDPTQHRWEEAIVEQLQRLIRHEVLDMLQVSLNAEIVQGLDDLHRYNAYIRTLEIYREAERRQRWDFYLDLLKSSPVERARRLVRAMRAPTERREEEE
jgi:hypothetical protein